MTNKQTQKHKLTSQKKHSSEELTFLEHLGELRNRVFWAILALVVTSAIGFQFKDALIDIVMAPLEGEKLVYLTPGGGFSFIFTLSIYFGLLLSIPVIVYQLYKFLQPLVRNASKRLVVSFIVLSGLLAAIGAIFGYFVAIPAALDFLTTFSGDAVSPNLTADSYLSFVVAYTLGLAALFQLPLLLFMIDYIKPFKPGKLLSSQRFVIIGGVIAAAIITPTPDIVNMMIIAMPVILAYQVGAVAVYAHRRMRQSARITELRSRVMPETPEDVLTAVIERESFAAISEPAMPNLQESTPIEAQHVQRSVRSPQVSKPNQQTRGPVQRVRPNYNNRFMDGIGSPLPKAGLVQYPRSTDSPTVSPQHVQASHPIRPKRTVDGFTVSSAVRLTRRPSRPMMPTPTTAMRAPIMRNRARSLDGFSMA